MANQFLQQLNQFGQFLERDVVRIEQEGKRKRLNETVVQAAAAFKEASTVGEVAEVYQDTVAYSASNDILEGMDAITPMYQQKLTTLEYQKQEDSKKKLGQWVESLTGMKPIEGMDPAKQWDFLMKTMPEKTLKIMEDAEGQQREIMFTKSVIGKNGQFETKVETEWRDKTFGVSSVEKAKDAVRAKKDIFKYQHNLKGLMMEKEYEMKQDILTMGSAGFTPAQRNERVRILQANKKMYDTAAKAQAGVVLNFMMQGNSKVLKKYFPADEDKMNPYSKELMKENPDVILKSMLSNKQFVEDITKAYDTEEWYGAENNPLTLIQNYMGTLGKQQQLQERINMFVDPYAPTTSTVKEQQEGQETYTQPQKNYLHNEFKFK